MNPLGATSRQRQRYVSPSPAANRPTAAHCSAMPCQMPSSLAKRSQRHALRPICSQSPELSVDIQLIDQSIAPAIGCASTPCLIVLQGVASALATLDPIGISVRFTKAMRPRVEAPRRSDTQRVVSLLLMRSTLSVEANCRLIDQCNHPMKSLAFICPC